jgi:hypothetical protein
VLALAAAWAMVAAPAAGAARPPLLLHAEVSGSTLLAHVSAAPNSRCRLRLAGGGKAVSLPPLHTGSRGRGLIRWPIPSDTAVGAHSLQAHCAHAGSGRSAVATVTIPKSAVSGTLTMVLNVLLDVILGASLALFLFLLVSMVVREPDPGERLMRSLALICGALVALGAQAANVGIASYTIESLTGARPGGDAFKLAAVLIPGGVAAAFGWYFVRAMRRSTAMALRLVSFLGMLATVSFIVIFAEATNTQGVFLGAAAIPNASFVIGLIGSVVLFNSPADAQGGRSGLGFLTDYLRGRGARRRRVDDAATGGARRNPFADE